MKDFDTEQTVIAPPLSAPHFDDEATLVTARPVVPISTAEALERSRIVRRALPFIVVAGLVGILIGFGVGYRANRRASSEVVTQLPSSQQPNNNLSSPGQEQTANETESSKPNVDSNADSTSSGAKTVNNVALATPGNIPPAKRTRPVIHKTATVSRDRQRPRSSRGAARIQEIFAGSNPQ